jgi:DNA-binding MarR family transcriptional regulator
VKKSSSLVALERELAYLVRMLEAVQRKQHYPLERAQYMLLELLRENGPQPVANLAERLVLDSSTVARQVASMEQQELIDRIPNPDDGRSMLVRATQLGAWFTLGRADA